MVKDIIIYVAIAIVLIFGYVKYIESRGIYFPIKEIENTPEIVGLPFEDIYIKTEDDIQINGWFIPQERPRGTLLFCHGNAGNISHRLEIIKIFHKIDLNVFIFDYRGYGRSQGSPSEQGLYRDARAAFNYLVSREDINKEAIVVYGKSIGANVAVDLLSGVSAKALISESAFTCAAEMGKKLFPYLPVKWIITIKYDALTKIRNITVPKLIIHSRDDEIIPFRLGEKLFEAASEPKEFYRMSGGHNEAVFLAAEEFSARIDAFLGKYLNRSTAPQ